MLTEQTISNDRIEVTADGSLQIREATVIMRDGALDENYPAKYHRYVLRPGDDLTGKDGRIVAVANSVWTPEVIEAYQGAAVAG